MTRAWSIVITGAMEHCDDKGMEHCDDTGMEHCNDRLSGAL